jgi:hypothetical protein
MRAEQYIRVGSPKLEEKIQFRSVDSGDNVTLDIIQITINAVEVINASKSVSEDKEVRDVPVCLNSDKINNVNVMHTLNAEYQDTTENLITSVNQRNT